MPTRKCPCFWAWCLSTIWPHLISSGQMPVLSTTHLYASHTTYSTVLWTSQGDLQVLTGTIVVPLSEISSPNNLANSFFPFQRLLSLPQEWLLVSFSAFLKSLILTYFIVFYAVLTNYTKKSVNAKEVNFIHPRDLWHSALRGTQSLTVW